MQNPSLQAVAALDDGPGDSLLASFKPGIAPEDVETVWLLKRAQPLLAGFTALFHGGFNGVLLRLLVLRELAADTESTALTRNDINTRLAYLDADALETVLARLRSHDLLSWDAAQSVYRVSPMARNILAALEGLMRTGQGDDEAEMGFLLSQVAGAQAMGGVSADQLHQLLGRLMELKEEFSDAIASGSEFRLRQAQQKWHTACDWVERGSQILHAITSDPRADNATHRAAQAIGRAQGQLLNMQGMFSRALNQIERQRVHLGQSGLSTTDIKTWLMRQDDLASLASGALSFAVTPGFITPHEMLDVAETELLADHASSQPFSLPGGEDVAITQSDAATIPAQLSQWLDQLDALTSEIREARPVAQTLLPAGFAIASYRASLLPLLGDPAESSLQGPTADIARLPLNFVPADYMDKLKDPEIAAMSAGHLQPRLASDASKE
jgi:hypothetical protein